MAVREALIVLHALPGDARAHTALRLAGALLADGKNVTLFLVEAGGGLLVPHEGEDPQRALFAELCELGLGAHVCGATLRKLGLRAEDLPESVQPSSMKALSAMMSRSDHVPTKGVTVKLNIMQAAAVLLAGSLLAGAAHAAGDDVVDAMEEYMMFVDYSGSTIRPEQIPADDWNNIYVIDARDADQYAREHIPGAVNVEWRQVLDHRDALPRDRSVLIYCNSGTLSAQAGFALRLAGHENVRILQGGLDEWKRMGGFEAYERAVAEEAR